MRTIGTTAVLMALATTLAVAQTPPTTPSTPTPTVQTMPAQPAPVTRVTPGEISAAHVMTTLPAEAATITHWYKQAVYDQGNSKIGDIEDVLVDHDGKVSALIIGVGGFLGMARQHCGVLLPMHQQHGLTVAPALVVELNPVGLDRRHPAHLLSVERLVWRKRRHNIQT